MIAALSRSSEYSRVVRLSLSSHESRSRTTRVQKPVFPRTRAQLDVVHDFEPSLGPLELETGAQAATRGERPGEFFTHLDNVMRTSRSPVMRSRHEVTFFGKNPKTNDGAEREDARVKIQKLKKCCSEAAFSLLFLSRERPTTAEYKVGVFIFTLFRPR